MSHSCDNIVSPVSQEEAVTMHQREMFKRALGEMLGRMHAAYVERHQCLAIALEGYSKALECCDSEMADMWQSWYRDISGLRVKGGYDLY
ncbi:hypothetical protein GYMLUDRAFT_247950 [Collybiopsis luxurians FD-317 M1]|uniref:Uncharacterized protein n=1 Tax=Collybiopsis luxurians FD-317 M1 TaxID=944289 RepID=A0A0D0CML5_9AGAR|nr:hypothetical protein GYMLUDRAFT_247950 [Collybiopsis luxurians FD-317 M1]